MGGSIWAGVVGEGGVSIFGDLRASKQAWEMNLCGDGVVLDRAGGFFRFQATAQTRSTIVGGKWYLQNKGHGWDGGTSHGMGGPGKARLPQRIDTRARDYSCRLLLFIKLHSRSFVAINEKSMNTQLLNRPQWHSPNSIAALTHPSKGMK